MHTLTRNSRSAHGVLSEPHMRAHDWKGREGKGKGNGGEDRVETPHHVVQLGDVAARLGMMSGAKR